LLLRYIFQIASKIFGGYGLGNNPVIAKYYHKLGKKTFGDFLIYEGQKFFLDTEGSIALAMIYFDHEKYELSLLKSIIKQGDVIVDIGANLGLYTLTAAKSVGTAGKVYSIEPNPIVFSSLKKNVKENNHQNVVLINKAVSSFSGSTKLSFDSENSISTESYLIREETGSQKFVSVETISLDDFFKNISNKVNVIKMDIEGAEFEALKGMKNLLENNNTLNLFLEFNPRALNKMDVCIPEFIDYLVSFHFIIYNIDEKNKIKKRVDKNWLLKFAKDNPKRGYTNLQCTKTLNNFEK